MGVGLRSDIPPGLWVCRNSHSTTLNFKKIFLEKIIILAILNKTKLNNKKQEELNDDMMPSFLDQSKLNEINSKMEEGKLTCNIDNPEACENCGS